MHAEIFSLSASSEVLHIPRYTVLICVWQYPAELYRQHFVPKEIDIVAVQDAHRSRLAI